MVEIVRRDDVSTLLAIGALAYAFETMVHEAGGHGGVCIAQGHTLLVVTPLWMRCDVVTRTMTAGGPVANMIAAAISAMALWSGWTTRLPIQLFVWLSLVFNALVAAGYMVVGGTIAFGDWPYLFGGIEPEWLWRAGLVVVGSTAYWGMLRVVTRAYGRFAGADVGRFVRRALIPSCGAALIAVAAQLYGQGGGPGGLILPLVCTVLVGASVSGMRDLLVQSDHGAERRLSFSVPFVTLGIAVSAGYICVVGPGAHG